MKIAANPPPGALAAAILTFSGPDALPFAHAQLSSRIDRLAAETWQWTAWLSASGRVRFLGMAWRDGDDVHILLRGGTGTPHAEALTRYRVRAAVQFAVEPVIVSPDSAPLPEGRLARNGAELRLGLGDHGLVVQPGLSEAEPSVMDDPVWLPAIRAGHPWLPAAWLDRLLPPALNLAGLEAVTLGRDKGCYPGQEIVNRLRSRGGHKYVLAHLRLAEPPPPGELLSPLARPQERVLARAGHDVLAVLHETGLAARPPGEVLTDFRASRGLNSA